MKNSKEKKDKFFETELKFFLAIAFVYFFILTPLGIKSPYEDQIMIVLTSIVIGFSLLYFTSHKEETKKELKRIFHI
jgi:quinol-cytochrome oxidoreductase complex cytochrome b subunit